MDTENSVNKYIAQLALVLLFLVFACPVVIRAADAPAQPPVVTDAELFTTIATLDAEVFDAYNRCDLEKFASYFIGNLEFHESSHAGYPIKDFGAEKCEGIGKRPRN
jgi:hypothetical protein